MEETDRELEYFNYIENQETKDYYSKEILISQAKINKLEKEGKITLKKGHDIKTKNILQKTFERKNLIYFGKTEKEFPLPIETAKGQTILSIINDEEISKKLQTINETKRSKIGYIHISTIQIIIKSTYLKGIDSPISLIILDNRIRSKKEKIIGIIEGNLKNSVIKFNVALQYAIPLITKNLNDSIGILYNFKRQNLMRQGDHPLTVTYAVSYALTNSIHSIDFLTKENIYLDDIFKETTKIKILENNPLNKSTTLPIDPAQPILKTFKEEKDEETPKKEAIFKPINLSHKSEYEILKTQIEKINKDITILNEKI